jgi:hypothetical protein
MFCGDVAVNPRIGAIDDGCSRKDGIAAFHTCQLCPLKEEKPLRTIQYHSAYAPFGECWEPRLVDCGDKEGGLRGGS